MVERIVGFAAILLTALALVPVGAHLAALPNKIGLDASAYLIVQGIYRGWALWGVALVAALVVDLGYAVLLRRQPRRLALALGAGLLVAATLAVFFVWVYPANQATANWTALPADWQRLRWRWEYGHAIEAVLTFFALAAITGAALSDRG